MKKSKVESKSARQNPVEQQTEGNKVLWMICATLFFLSFVVYFNTIGHGFVLDDPLAIELNKNVTSGVAGVGDILKGGYRENNFGGQLYRPVSLVQFAVEWQISPNNPAIHHFFNVFWYAASVVLMFLVLRGWFKGQNILLPTTMAILFALHPIHTEVVANIKSRDEIMSLFFILASFFTFHRYIILQSRKWIFSSLMLYFLALISKESAVTMFPVFGMMAWWIGQKNVKQSIMDGIWFVIPVLILLAIRASIFGSQPSPATDIMDNPIVSAQGWGERLPTALVILWKYITLQVFPHPLACDYSYIVIPVTDFKNLVVWASIFLHTILAIVFFKGFKAKNMLSFLILGYMLAISLFSQIPLVIGTMFGERLAFLASFWFVAGMMYLAGRFFIKDNSAEENNIIHALSKNMVFVGIASVIGVGFAFKTITRNTDWKDNFTLFTKDAATHTQSVRLQNGAADQLVKASETKSLSAEEISSMMDKAEQHCNAIMNIRPVPTLYLTLGNIRIKQKRYEDAIKYYDQVNDLKDIVNLNKALAYRELGRKAGEIEQNITKSQDLLGKSLLFNNRDAETWYLTGVSYGVLGNHQKAAEHFEKAYELKPGPEYVKSVITAYQNLGNQAKVKEYQKYISQ
ncbi:MAG: tetratricopeptide repeat protein [Saprospiraceae bacterium]|nr:tetratricopeptide repeat protein [Saprospiraceae bacterium]